MCVCVCARARACVCEFEFGEILNFFFLLFRRLDIPGTVFVTPSAELLALSPGSRKDFLVFVYRCGYEAARNASRSYTGSTRFFLFFHKKIFTCWRMNSQEIKCDIADVLWQREVTLLVGLIQSEGWQWEPARGIYE